MLDLQAREGGVQFRVKVVPGASRSRIEGEMGGALKVAVSAPPEKGKANEAVLALLAEALGVKLLQLRLVAGGRSPHKRCLVTGLSEEQVREALGRAVK